MCRVSVKEKILNKFVQQNSKPNEIIFPRWINKQFLPQLNPKEQDTYQDAVNELVNEGLIEVDKRAGGQALVLTKDGFDKIYDINKSETKKKIKNSIMSHFEDRNSRPNQVITLRWVRNKLVRNLNPKEQNLVEESINDLEKSGLIEFDKRALGECLVLTDAGYETLY